MKMKTRVIAFLAAAAAVKTAFKARKAKEYRYLPVAGGSEELIRQGNLVIKIRTLIILFLLAALGVAGFVYFGVYNVAATKQHSPPLYYLLHFAMRRSVAMRADDIKVPDLGDAQRTRNGFVLYREYCLQCHGAPGVAPDPVGLGLRPEPANLIEAAKTWRAAEVYWVVRHGLKMTAMPAWEYRLTDAELWDLVAFVKAMPALSPQQYQEWELKQPATKPQPAQVAVSANAPASASDAKALGDAKAGRHAIEQYMCITCHRIPDVTGADKTVGPPLSGIATRKYIGGVLVNTPENMIRWLRDPKQVDPLSAMPNLHIREKDLRDITAYLYTLK